MSTVVLLQLQSLTPNGSGTIHDVIDSESILNSVLDDHDCAKGRGGSCKLMLRLWDRYLLSLRRIHEGQLLLILEGFQK